MLKWQPWKTEEKKKSSSKNYLTVSLKEYIWTSRSRQCEKWDTYTTFLSLMACTIIRNEKVMRKRKQWVKKNTPLFVMQLFLHIHCSLGFFKAAHVPTDIGWWARILAASSWGLKRKKIPNEWLSTSTFRAVVPLSRVLCSAFLGHLAISPPCLHYSGYNSRLLTWEKALRNSKGLICAEVAPYMVGLLPSFHTYSVVLCTTFLSWSSPSLCA